MRIFRRDYSGWLYARFQVNDLRALLFREKYRHEDFSAEYRDEFASICRVYAKVSGCVGSGKKVNFRNQHRR